VAAGKERDQQAREHNILSHQEFAHLRPHVLDLLRLLYNPLFDLLNVNAAHRPLSSPYR
jgi:hypothetical protein